MRILFLTSAHNRRVLPRAGIGSASVPCWVPGGRTIQAVREWGDRCKGTPRRRLRRSGEVDGSRRQMPGRRGAVYVRLGWSTPVIESCNPNYRFGSEAEIQLGHLQLSRDCFSGESVVLSARPKTVCRRQSPERHVSAMIHLRPSRVFVATHLVSLVLLPAPSFVQCQRSISARFPTWL
jgi:hypothetical protein